MIKHLYYEFIGNFTKKNMIIVILYFLIAFVLGLSESVDMIMIATIWLYIFNRPEMDKTIFLMPLEKKDYMITLIIKTFASFFFNFILFSIVISIFSINRIISLHGALKILFCEGFPCLMAYSALFMNDIFELKIIKEGRYKKRNLAIYISSLVLIIIPFWISLWKGLLLSRFNTASLTIISYSCTILIIYWQIILLKQTDYSYQNIRKREKIF